MKSKIKKILISIQLFFVGVISKVFAISFDEPRIETAYGIEKVPTPIEKYAGIGKLIVPIILFVIGLFVVISKKITKKVKRIVISILIILGILGWIGLNYIV